MSDLSVDTHLPMASLPSQEPGRPATRAVPRTPWLGFLLRRAVALVVILFVLALASFLLLRLVPGDPALAVTGPDATAADLARVHAQLGLDRPFPSQLGSYLGGLLHGDMGTSFGTREPVSDIVGRRFGVSAQLAGFSLLVVIVLSIPLGVLVGVFTRNNRHRSAEASFTALASVLGAIPEFLMATLLATVFAVWLQLLPVAGLQTSSGLILPVIAIAVRPTFLLARIVRLETLNVLAQDYIRTARSKRLRDWTIYTRHLLPNVVTSALSVGGVLFAGLIGGAVLVENVFALPGLGTALVQGVVKRDYPVVQGVILVLGIAVVVINAVVDVLLGIIDPRNLAKATS